MGIETKSTGVLIDELISTSMKCWFAQEQVMQGGSAEEVAEAAIRAQALNRRRNDLIRAIDVCIGDTDISPTGKTY